MRVSVFVWMVALVCSCYRNQEKTTPVREKITEAVYASGIVKTKNQYQAFSTVTGIVGKVFVTENDEVKAGAPIMLVTDKPSGINRENASLAATYADITVNSEKLTDAQNSIVLAQATCSNDSIVFKRQQNLWNQGIGSRFELEQQELAYMNAKTALKSATIRYNDLVRQLTFNTIQARNNLAISKYKEGDYTIRSEIDGRVYSLSVEPGEMVRPQTPLAVIGDATVFLMDLQIDEYDIVKIKEGHQVIVSMDSYKGQVFSAKITRIYPLMNENTRSFVVEAVFVQQPPVLYPNLTAEANIIIRTKENALTIPRNYLSGDSAVLLAKDKKKTVVTGLRDYLKVEIIEGLSPGDIIYKPEQ